MHLPDDSQLNRLGDFELLRELGRGGMGIVYEIRQVSLNRGAAWKAPASGYSIWHRAMKSATSIPCGRRLI